MERYDKEQSEAKLSYMEIKLSTIATLKGLRGMAEIEANNGSKAWARTIAMIDIAIDEMEQL